MSIENDFLKARTQISAKIQGIESELKYWRDELSAFDRVETAMRRLNVNVNGDEPSSKNSADKKQSGDRRTSTLLGLDIAANESGKKRGDLKKQILKIVVDTGKHLSSTEVERTMLRSGYKPTGKHFDISVYQTLLRLADSGLIGKAKDGRKVRFFSKSA